MEIKWQNKPFDELTTGELYGILRLRAQVFVVEQHCAYQDVDDKDIKAYHLFGKSGKEIIAYLRIFRAGDYFQEASVGRVVVAPSYRRKGIALQMMKRAVSFLKVKLHEPRIRISAQVYLLDFYMQLGFKPVGLEYLEDGIPHRSMILV